MPHQVSEPFLSMLERNICFFRNVPLFLEWAPIDIYTTPKPTKILARVEERIDDAVEVQETETEKLKRLLDEEDTGRVLHVSLFVKNLSFQTTEKQLAEVFANSTGFVRVRKQL